MSSGSTNALRLRPGEWVEIRSKAEILESLAGDATLDGLPFMPEMFQFCGKRVRVYKRADKTCDTVDGTGGLRLRNTVHLEGLRCDGSAHGGCEARCLIFWREAWLKRADDLSRGRTASPEGASRCTQSDVDRAAIAADDEHETFRCQATQLKRFTKPLPWWSVRQYVRDVTTNGVSIGKLVSALVFSCYRKLTELGIGYRVLVRFYDWVQARRGGVPFPFRAGTCEKTPTAALALNVGEFVRVKSYAEILATLDKNNKNRGLWFDAEMVRYCGEIHRVAQRVRRIVDEKTGRMLEFSNPCIVLEDVCCRGEKTKGRLFCPRSIPIYWREIWLERIEHA